MTIRHDLFGRYRDEMQQIPAQWIVAGRTALRPPEDSFFEAIVSLEPFGALEIRQLLERRAKTARNDDQQALERVAVVLADMMLPSTPRAVLARARSVLLSQDPEATLRGIRKARNALFHQSATANKVFAALVALGPTHAGDERLLSEIGTSRNRIVQVLRELEDAGVVVSELDGKRKIYGADLGPNDPTSADPSASDQDSAAEERSL